MGPLRCEVRRAHQMVNLALIVTDDLEFRDELGSDGRADISRYTPFPLSDELHAHLSVLPHRRRLSLITSISVLRRLLVDFDQLRDIELRRRLSFLSNPLQNQLGNDLPRHSQCFQLSSCRKPLFSLLPLMED